MATVILSSSGWSDGTIRVTYTASNGTLTITEIAGKRGDGYRSYNENDTAITVSVDGTSKSISLSHYVDFGASDWVTWGATDTSWTILTGTSISISTTMQSGTPAYSSYTFTGNATMSWSTYTVTYNATLDCSNIPSSQTKTYGEALFLSSTIPIRTGYTFSKWNTASDGSGTSYNAGASYTKNASITLYAIWTENTITVNHYSNYATYGTCQGETLDVSASKNALVLTSSCLYDNSYPNGLSDVQNTSYLYLLRTGYTPTGYWGTTTSGGTLVHQKTSFDTGQALAEALGKDISNGNASVNIYAQWRANVLTVNYHVNGGTVNSDTYYVNNNLIYSTSSSSVLNNDWNYNSTHSSGLYNATTFGLTREGYDFVGWGLDSSGTTIFDQDDTSIVPTDLTRDIETGDCTITLYAIWELSGVVYIDNGTSFEPYLPYIDNGTSWDLYLAYVDDGTNWNVIS